jgi:hypothetical protein
MIRRRAPARLAAEEIHRERDRGTESGGDADRIQAARVIGAEREFRWLGGTTGV